MKKLLTIATVAMLAFGVHAASVSWDWSVDGLYYVDGASDGYASGVIELVYGGNTMDTANIDEYGNAAGNITGTTTDAFASGAEWNAVASLDIGGETYKQTFAFTMPSGLNGDIQNDSPILTALNSDISMQVLGPEGYLDTSTMVSTYGWTKVDPVPEPTSVALLALGLAALGLKRKVA